MSDVYVTTPAGVASVLLDLSLAALTLCGSEPIEDAYVAAGAIAWDSCCGLLVAAPERTYRSASFPEEGATTDNCDVGELACEMLVLLLRCVPVLDERGQPPLSSALDTAYRAILRDAAILWDAFMEPMPEGWSRANLTQLFVGAEGGCIGVETRLTIGLPQASWCRGCPD